MKLIDLLVQELPKRGGWPQNVTHIGQDYDRELMFYGRWDVSTGIFLDELAADHRKRGETGARVTQEQYESALAESQKPAWSGEGLPPVGCECESKQFSQVDWYKFKVVAVCDGHVFGFWGNGVSTALDSKMWEFRPLRTEAEKKRDAAIEKIKELLMFDHGDDQRVNDAIFIYDAIAAGKIPGVKLDD